MVTRLTRWVLSGVHARQTSGAGGTARPGHSTAGGRPWYGGSLSLTAVKWLPIAVR